jgi:hypothetical protein
MEYMKHYKFPNEKFDFVEGKCTYTEKMFAKIVDMRDKAIIDCVVEFAKEQGITDLFLLDAEFVKTALIREIERRREGEQI